MGVKENHLHEVLSSLSSYVGLLDEQGRLRLVNPAPLGDAGWRREEVLGRPFADTPWWAYDPEVSRTVRQAVEQALAGQEVRDLEVCAIGREGTLLPLLLSVSPLRSGDRVVGAVASAVPILKLRRREEELRVYRYLLDSMAEFAAILDLEGRVRFANRASLELLPEEERPAVIGRRLWEAGWFTEESVPKVRRAVQEAAGGREVELEVAGRRRGALISAVLSVRPLRGEKGVMGLVASGRDITRLKELERLYRTLLEEMNEGFVLTDPEGRVALANPTLCRMLGREEGELRGRQLSAFVADPELMQREFRRRLQGERSRYRTEMLRPDGTRVPVLVSAAPLLEEGTFRGAIGVITDLTELEEHEERYRVLFEHNPLPLALLDERQVVRVVNPRFRELVGTDPRGRPIGEFLREEVGEGRRPMASGVERRQYAVQRGEGRREVEAWRIRIPQGSLLVCEDVTERRSMERMMRHGERLRALGEMATAVAHDFNNLLAAILGRVQLLKRHLQGERAPGRERRRSIVRLLEGLEVIERAASDGAETVRRIQEFARIAPERDRLQVVDLKAIVRDAVDFTRPRWRGEATQRGISIRVEVDLGRNGLWVRGNPSELREVFINLIVNALDAMPTGGTLTIFARRRGSWATVEVRDTGCGMSPEVKRRIFDPFFTTKGPGSTGLGLAVSYAIISRHAGRIEVDSAPGRGSTFSVWLPLEQRGQRRAAASAQRAVRERVGRILVIDDEQEVREVLAEMLSLDGHQVVCAAEGAEGVRTFEREGPFDLVLTDLSMPGMNGWEVARRIRQLNPRVPIALLTGWGIRPDQEQTRQLGVSAVINKPFTVDYLLNLVQEVLRGGGGEPAVSG